MTQELSYMQLKTANEARQAVRIFTRILFYYCLALYKIFENKYKFQLSYCIYLDRKNNDANSGKELYWYLSLITYEKRGKSENSSCAIVRIQGYKIKRN